MAFLYSELPTHKAYLKQLSQHILSAISRPQLKVRTLILTNIATGQAGLS